MENNLISMAREVEKLRVEVLNAEKRAQGIFFDLLFYPLLPIKDCHATGTGSVGVGVCWCAINTTQQAGVLWHTSVYMSA